LSDHLNPDASPIVAVLVSRLQGLKGRTLSAGQTCRLHRQRARVTDVDDHALIGRIDAGWTTFDPRRKLFCQPWRWIVNATASCSLVW
jgi:hypothetical protein